MPAAGRSHVPSSALEQKSVLDCPCPDLNIGDLELATVTGGCRAPSSTLGSYAEGVFPDLRTLNGHRQGSADLTVTRVSIYYIGLYQLIPGL